MPDEAKTLLEEQVVVDPQAEVVVPPPDTTAKTIASLQRELQRTRNRLSQVDQLNNEIGSMRTSIEALVQTLAGQETLDDAGRQTLGTVQQIGRFQADTAARRAATTNEIHNIAVNMGVTSWDDPRVADVVEAFEEGDLSEALSLVKQARRINKAKSQEVDVKDPVETMVKAEVARRLKEMGVREVDKAKPAAPPPPKGLQDLLAQNTDTMTAAQRETFKKDLLAAARKG